ncbi:MAG: hypothetical protein RLZZ63_350 [Gemmatimonadota bacterium]|jgi:hypothetical protein
MRILSRIPIIVGVLVLGACSSPSEPVVLVDPELTSFTLPKSLNPQLPSDVTGEIRGDTVRLVIPTVVAVDSLIPVFATTDPRATTRVGTTVQQSGQTRINFGGPVTLVLTSPSGATRSYIVDVIVFTGLPVITITTDGGAPILNREDYVNATIDIYGGRGRPEWSQRTTTQIRGRGNSTWFAPKKPYRLKLTSSASIFGFPADRDWALLANYWDLSLSRNALAFEFSRQVQMAYTPRCTPFELVLNGVHQGSYQLCDHQEVATNRIPAGSKGWYLELTSLQRVEADEVHFSTPRVENFSREWGTSVWVYKQPDPPSADQRATIEAQMLRAETVLYGAGFADPDTGYAAHFDVESVIDWYLVMELTKNNDATFFNGVKIYRTETGKITFGPVWDFDLAFGRHGFDFAPTGWRIKHAAWIGRFFDDRAFITKLKTQWQALYLKRAQLDAYLLGYSRQLQLSQRLTHAKWAPYEPTPSIWLEEMGLALPTVRSLPLDVLFTDADYTTEVNTLRTWLDARWAWLNTAIMDL